MKMQNLFVVTLAILLAAGVALSQQSAGVSQAPARTPPANEPPSSSPQNIVVTKLVSLEYYPANELRGLLLDLIRGEGIVVADARSNQLIITGQQERVNKLEEIIARLDVPDQAMQQQAQYLTCRVYMFELPAKDQSLKPFSLVLERSSEFLSAEVMAAARDASVQVDTLLQREEDNVRQLILEGRAISNEGVQQMLTKIPSQVKQLKWDDETFAATIPAASVSRLPSSLQDHIREFLGDKVQTVGYWFGNLSVPGDLNTPIGPWQLDMKAQSGQGTDLVLEVRVTRESPIPFVNETQLLSNTIQGKAGRPIIIGYNRQSYGTRVMGAMVVLLEADTTPAAADEAKPK
jgi:hypothetical protein